MKTVKNLAIVSALAVAVVAAVYIKNSHRSVVPPAITSAPNQVSGGVTSLSPDMAEARPLLVDFGASKCIPCKKMAPILENLKENYSGKLDVEFVDVWQNPEAGRKYGIRVIPTQIFFAADGKELFRHEGFLSKEDILGKWKDFGYVL